MDLIGAAADSDLALWQDPSILFMALGAVVLIWIGLAVLSGFLCICGPHEILVISGRRHVLSDGSTVGYKVLHGGRGIRIPILEEINRMDTRLIPVMVEVRNAYSKGGIPLIVHAIVNVKISTYPRRG